VEIIWRYPQNWRTDDKGNISISLSCMIFLLPNPLRIREATPQPVTEMEAWGDWVEGTEWY
jgi:hypothetical protein